MELEGLEKNKKLLLTFRILFGYDEIMPLRLDIPEKVLKELYLDQCQSSRKIAKLYHCAYSTIDRKIHLAGFPIRNLAQAHIIYPRKDFSGNLTEKAYLIGFRIGDLRVRKFYKNSETIKVDCGSTKVEQINLIQSLFSLYGRVWLGRPNKQGATQIECFLNTSFNFLLAKEVPKWIFGIKKYFFSFLAGFTDAEGTIFISRKQNLAVYALGNYDLILLQTLKSYLEKYNIMVPKLKFSKRKGLLASHGYRYNHDYWTLAVSKKSDLIKLFNLMGPNLKHQKRIRQMKIAIENIEERNRLYG